MTCKLFFYSVSLSIEANGGRGVAVRYDLQLFWFRSLNYCFGYNQTTVKTKVIPNQTFKMSLDGSVFSPGQDILFYTIALRPKLN